MRQRVLVTDKPKKSFAGFVDYINNSKEALNIMLRIGMVMPFVVCCLLSLISFWYHRYIGGLILWGLGWLFWLNMRKNIALFRTDFDSNIQGFVYGKKRFDIKK